MSLNIPVHFCDIDNFGDQLNKELFMLLPGSRIVAASTDEADVAGVGSILEDLLVRYGEPTKSSTKNAINIFGSGFGHDKGNYIHDDNIQVPEKFSRPVRCYALRGKLTRSRVESILGKSQDGIPLGDPGLLVNELVKHRNIKKIYSLGIVPHFADKDNPQILSLSMQIENSKILDPTKPPKQFLEEIMECETVVSTALHPLIACDALGIPNMWIRVSEGTTTRYKFNDYYSVFDISKTPTMLTSETLTSVSPKTVKDAYDIPVHKVRRIQTELKRALNNLADDIISRRGVKNFNVSTATDRTVLIVEPNPYHGEVIPGYAKYFKDLGYRVDVLLREELRDEKVFSYCPLDMISGEFYGTAQEIAYTLGSKKLKGYDLVFFSSNVYWEGRENYSSYIRFLDHVPAGKFGSLFVEHNLSSLIQDDAELFYASGRVSTLLPYLNHFDGSTTRMINPHYFGDNIASPAEVAQDTIRIAVVGGSNREGSLLTQIFSLARECENVTFTITGGNVVVPDDIKNIVVEDRLSFADYYKLIEQSDYLLTLFDYSKTDHKRYLNGTTSGTVQLSLGFRKPMIMEEDYASNYGFSGKNAIIFNRSIDRETLRSLALRNSAEYEALVGSLNRKAKQAYQVSLANLQEAIDNLEERSLESQKAIDQAALLLAQHRARIENDDRQRMRLEQVIADQRSLIESKEFEIQAAQVRYNEAMLLLSSRRYKLANKIGSMLADIVPIGSKRRYIASIPFKLLHQVYRMLLSHGNKTNSVVGMSKGSRRVIPDYIVYGVGKTKSYLTSRSGMAVRLLKWRQAGGELANIEQSQRDAYIEYAKTIIQKSGLFNEKYYLRNNPDVSQAGVDPLQHFVRHGGQELRNPSEAFDSVYYIQKNRLPVDAEINPLLHYLSRYRVGHLSPQEYSTQKARIYRDSFISDMQKSIAKSGRVVIMESMAWSGSLQQRPHHIARLLAKRGISVVYIDTQAPKSTSIPVKVEGGVYLINDISVISKLAKTQHVNKYYWLFSTTPLENTRLREILAQGYELIYDYIDDFDEDISGDIVAQLKNYKSLDVLKPAIAIASASNLLGQIRDKLSENNVLLCQNAVDMDHFHPDQHADDIVPEDMIDILEDGKPIVGYYGAIAPWLDYRLINNLTKKRTDLNFVFIGIDYNGGLANLELRENVYFLGPKDYTDLASYSRHFDCATIPFQSGDIAKSTSPVKLFEYMAMAIPTICTKDLNECRGYEYVYMSQDEKEFEANIDEAIKARRTNESKEALIRQAEENTWEARVDTIYNEMIRIEKERRT